MKKKIVESKNFSKNVIESAETTFIQGLMHPDTNDSDLRYLLPLIQMADMIVNPAEGDPELNLDQSALETIAALCANFVPDDD